MTWVKLHDDILGDPKLIRAVRAGHAQLVLLPWLLVFAKQSEDGGRLSVGGLPADPEDIAHQLPGVAAGDVAVALESLLAIGVLVRQDEFLVFDRWASRQEKPSDSKAAIRERVKKHRALTNDRVKNHRSNAEKPDVTPPAALQETPCNALLNLGDVTPCNATEKRRGEEKRREEETTVPIPAPVIVLLPSGGPSESCADVDAVLAHHRLRHPRKRPDDKARKATVKAFSRDYSVADLVDAIDGNADDPWCKKTSNQGLPYLFRDNATIDKYIAQKAQNAPAVTDARDLYDYDRMELSAVGERMTRP